MIAAENSNIKEDHIHSFSRLFLILSRLFLLTKQLYTLRIMILSYIAQSIEKTRAVRGKGGVINVRKDYSVVVPLESALQTNHTPIARKCSIMSALP